MIEQMCQKCNISLVTWAIVICLLFPQLYICISSGFEHLYVPMLQLVHLAIAVQGWHIAIYVASYVWLPSRRLFYLKYLCTYAYV